MRITNIVASVIVLALALSSWRFGDWTASAANDAMNGTFREIQEFAAHLAAVFLLGLSIIPLTLTRCEFGNLIVALRSPPEQPVVVVEKSDEVTRPGKKYESLFD
jgi:hypothetical protein